MKFSKIPEQWKTNITIPIFKKGERGNPEKYRGINLLNTHLKLTTAIIAEKLTKTVNLEDEQQCFRCGRSCTDAIFIVRQLAQKALEFNRHAFFCFTDIEKAFDKIHLKRVLNTLENQGIINLIWDIHTNNYTRIKIKGKLEGRIPVNQGIHQRDSLSPLLFNIVMNEIIKDLKGLQGYSLGDENVNTVCYADDATLVADNEDDLQ